MPEMLVRNMPQTLFNHAIPYAMSGFITELLTLAVYCYFLRSLYKG